MRNGKPAASIVLADTPTRAAQFAAAELQYHVEKITGAVLHILTNAAGVTGVCVFVGESGATRALGLKNEGFSPQEYLISFRKEGLILMGRDKEDRGKLNYAKPQTFPDGFDDQGTCYAVYDFLERYCGVRWYLPTDLGLVYTPAKTLVVGGPDVRRQPFMWHRLMSSEMRIPADLCGDTVEGEKQPLLDRREALLWSRRNRWAASPTGATIHYTGILTGSGRRTPKNLTFLKAHIRSGLPKDTKTRSRGMFMDGFHRKKA